MLKSSLTMKTKCNIIPKMRLKLCIIFILLLACVYSQQNIALVDMQSLFLDMARIQQLEETLDKKRDIILKDAKKRYGAIEKREKIYDSRKDLMTEEKKRIMYETIEYSKKLFKEDYPDCEILVTKLNGL